MSVNVKHQIKTSASQLVEVKTSQSDANADKFSSFHFVRQQTLSQSPYAPRTRNRARTGLSQLEQTLVDYMILVCVIVQVVQEYERAVIFRLGRLLPVGAKGPGE